MRTAIYLLTIALSLTAVALSHSAKSHPPALDAQARQIANGPYRDGLYLGHVDAKAGLAPYASIGRWNTTADRAAFRAGYDQGYKGY